MVLFGALLPLLTRHELQALLETIQKAMFAKAKAELTSHTIIVKKY